MFFIFTTGFLMMIIPTAYASEGLGIEKIITEKSSYNAGDKVTLFVIVNNTQGNPVKILDIRTLPFEKSEFTSVEIPPSSSKLIPVKLDMSDAKPGTYNLVAEVKSDEFFASDVTTVTLASATPALNANFESILFLLAAFIIPAQVVERILDQIKKGKWFDKDHDKYLQTVEEITGYELARKAYTGEAGKTSIEKLEELSAVNTKIGKAQDIKLGHEKIYQLKILIGGILLAIIPAIALSYFGFGFFQITGMDGQDFKFWDAVLNTLFIGVGTKPIHDVIEAIKKVQPKAS